MERFEDLDLLDLGTAQYGRVTALYMFMIFVEASENAL